MKQQANEPVDKKLFEQGLYCLGRTTNQVSFAYLAMNVSEQGLYSIAGIE